MIDSKYISTTPDETARFDFTRTNNKTQKRIELAAKRLWDIGLGRGTVGVPVNSFGDLTKKQKIDLVGEYINDIINQLAKTALYESNLSGLVDSTNEELETQY